MDLAIRGGTVVTSGARFSADIGIRSGKIAQLGGTGEADLVVWDPQERRAIKAAECFSKCDHTIYEGWEVQGWPRYTINRGEVVYADRRITAQPGRGRLLGRARFGALEGL